MRTGVAVLLSLLLTGCAEERGTPAGAEPRSQQGRLFDSQRSALEQARETAGFVELRGQQFQKREREID